MCRRSTQVSEQYLNIVCLGMLKRTPEWEEQLATSG